jgi:hypothetical protein
MTSVHKYLEPPKVSSVGSTRQDTLEEHTYTAPLQSPLSKAIGDVSSLTSSTSWYTCSADRFGARYLDSEVLDFANRRKCWLDLDNIWLSEFLSFDHNIVVREVLDPATRGRAYFPTVRMPSSGACVWPADEQLVNTMPMTYSWSPSVTAKLEDMVLCVCRLDQWEACSFEWLAPC